MMTVSEVGGCFLPSSHCRLQTTLDFTYYERFIEASSSRQQHANETKSNAHRSRHLLFKNTERSRMHTSLLAADLTIRRLRKDTPLTSLASLRTSWYQDFLLLLLSIVGLQSRYPFLNYSVHGLSGFPPSLHLYKIRITWLALLHCLTDPGLVVQTPVVQTV